ncbi:claudin 15-like b isoform X1 [Lampris incognitus]|uniref:claudin 15-like b isoform X1 n=1 Tax=Lampris incognitus TaxID=2546036 RepID=UPI0024B5284B|nr:claudin 15-like b isoform X1 [Lampris incognitus]XP_056139678.1 claudin 15-like b isoform X1 [Lampris incognitus]
MAVALQVVGLVLGVLSWCLQSSCTSSQVWKFRSQSDSVSSSVQHFEGLWMSCAATSLGSIQCNRYQTILGLPDYMQGCRALMALSLILGLTAIITSVLGLKCTKLGRTTEQTKCKMALTGGILFILSGILSLSKIVLNNLVKNPTAISPKHLHASTGVCTLIAVSWYAARIVQEFHDPYHVGVRFEFGTGLYLGWAAAGLAILGGSMLCCSCRRDALAPPAGQYSYNYSTKGGGQSIYRSVSESASSKAYV